MPLLCQVPGLVTDQVSGSALDWGVAAADPAVFDVVEPVFVVAAWPDSADPALAATKAVVVAAVLAGFPFDLPVADPAVVAAAVIAAHVADPVERVVAVIAVRAFVDPVAEGVAAWNFLPVAPHPCIFSFSRLFQDSSN